MVYKAESDSTLCYKEIKKEIFDLKKGKSAGPYRFTAPQLSHTSDPYKKNCAKILGVFRVKITILRQKNHIFSNCGGRRENCCRISCEK